ncbi:MAG: hypothetical protein H6720_12930 [Sandaracinus sp.]|nr:hypothetical protein [Sandaracinus sp.]
MAFEIGWGPRIGIAVVALSIAFAVDRLAGRRGSGRLAGVPVAETTRDRGWRSAVRTSNVGLVVLALGAVIFGDPIVAFGSVAISVTVAPTLLGVAARLAWWRQPERLPAIRPSAAHHLLHAGLVLEAGFFFRTLLPLLPGIVPLHWAGLGGDGYGPPTRLWWSVGLLLVGTAALLAAAYVAANGEGPAARRLALLRFAETALVGFDLAVVAVWIGVGLNGLPGLATTRPALWIAGGLALGGVVLGAILNVPAMRRAKRAAHDDAPIPPDPSTTT